MSPQDEKRIEQYVSHPEALTEGARAAVERMLATDPEARLWKERLASFYDAYAEAPEPSDEQLRQIVGGRPSTPRTIRLTPHTAPHGPTRMMADDGTGPSFRHLQTFASEQAGVMVRLMRDERVGTTYAFGLARHPEHLHHAVVALGQESPLIPLSFEEGVPVPDTAQPDEVSAPLTVYRCVCQAEVRAARAPRGPLACGGNHVIRASWPAADVLQLQVGVRSVAVRTLQFVRLVVADEVRTVHLDSGRATIPISDFSSNPPDELVEGTLYVY
ncbi:hypothetical protein [Salisaeta longa]|uniref:hypothetical protein n=1 Tax=Salisaeta longa TaxID=503170 RepID=UPI0003B46B5E|nr:hypothetical protein [Salisaeta longa]